MDDRKLETTRSTAIDPVQRCTPSCPSSTSCRFRRARRKLRERGKPCTHARAWQTRFALKVPRIYGCSLYTCASGAADPRDLAQAANDAALTELLLDGGTWCQADWRALIEEANKAEQPGPDGHRSRPGVTRTDFRPEVGVLMRLMRRKNKLINRCRAFRQAATDASSPEQLSGTATPKRGCVNACAAGTSASAARPIPIHQTQNPNPQNRDEKGDSQLM